MHPPKLDIEKLVGQRELIFVVDVSGSMWGVPLAMCKDAMREALKGLRPTDTFNIYSFSGHTAKAFPKSMPGNDSNITQAFKYINEAGTHEYWANQTPVYLNAGTYPVTMSLSAGLNHDTGDRWNWSITSM